VRRRLDRQAVFDTVNLLLLTIAALLCLYPLWFVVIASFSAPRQVASGAVILLPKEITFEGYHEVFKYGPLWRGYFNTIVYTVLGTLVNVVCTLGGGYALSRDDLPARGFFTFAFALTLVFNSGLIPRYLLVRNLGMLNTLWAMILPNAVNAYYLFMCRTYFASTIPGELLDAAKIDGCATLTFFSRIVLPLSLALVAIMVLYYGVFHWNSFFDAFLFLSDKARHPIQVVLRDLIIQNESASVDMDPMAADARQRLADLIKYGAIIFASAPILMLYPFLQRYFVRGVMIGAVKG
jgi:putative aldouronate transport system permease protein